MRKIKDIIVDSGRYEQILEKIVLLISRYHDDIDLPVNPYVDSKTGKCIFRVKTADIRRGIRSWLNNLSEEDPRRFKKDGLEEFEEYVSSTNDMYLHNYANSISHRVNPTEDMETIRILSVLTSSLNYMMGCFEDFETGELMEFNIPSGWKAEKAD